MICFPNAKINIGLEVIRKRTDSFHDLETVFYPVALSDILEMNESDNTKLTLTGLDIPDNPDNNLILKAYSLLKAAFNLPPVEFHLHKIIPMGAGLGGGSSDSAFTLTGLNQLFHLNLQRNKLLEFAAQLGSDCSFFILNYPVLAEEKGNLFSEITVNLLGLSLVLIKPFLSVSTALAYGGIKPSAPVYPLRESIIKPVNEWNNCIFNKFEENVFELYPIIGQIKKTLYTSGALYASMSGSGSTVYGLFEEVPPNLIDLFPGCFYWQEKCQF
jgi:4-diphosphocytidyl-2-C-methyl-D-erythritol kinase